MTDTPKSADQIVSEAISKANEIDAKVKEMEATAQTKDLPEQTEVSSVPAEPDKKPDEKKLEPAEDTKKELEKKETPEVDKEEKKMEERVASRFAALTRKEKALRMKEKELSDMATKYKELDSLVTLAKDNPIEAIKKLGLDYEQLTSFLLKGDKPELAKLSSLEKEIEELKQAKIQAEKMAEEVKITSTVNEFKTNIKTILAKESDTFELLNANPNAVEIVYNFISKDFDDKVEAAQAEGFEPPTTEDIMSIEEASKLIEDYLYAEVSKYSKLKKFAPKETVKAPESKEKTQEVKSDSTPKTLSNSMTNTTPPSKRPLTREEEIALVAKEYKIFSE